MKIEIRGNRFIMLPQKAMYWQDRKTMLLADLHLGKITHFRKSGIAIPSVAHADNLQRLDEIVSLYSPERIFLLGDLFHHTYNTEWDQFVAWRSKYTSLSMSIMLGNHDRLPLHMFDDADITMTHEHREGDFIFTHHPKTETNTETFVFAGHVHPVHTLRSGSSPTLRLPCFVIDPGQAILPSFGVFTGGYAVEAMPERQIFVVGDNSIFRI